MQWSRANNPAGRDHMPPLSQSRPKRAAAVATAEKILSTLKEERAAPGERDTSATATVQPAKRQRRAVPSSAVKVEKAKTEMAAAAGSQSAVDAAEPKSAAKVAPPKAVTPIKSANFDFAQYITDSFRNIILSTDAKHVAKIRASINKYPNAAHQLKQMLKV